MSAAIWSQSQQVSPQGHHRAENNHRRKWQEFYQCHCGTVWWAWSSDRPTTDFKSQ
ncbi:MAG: hypothetical protein ACHBN1_34585 [Heteroscytonema crispum UTEX LB 1556]